MAASSSTSDRVTKTNRGGDYEIFSMRPDGSRVRQVTRNTDDDFAPSVAANGKKITFMSNEETAENADGDAEIFVLQIPPDSSQEIEVTQLTINTEDDYEPVWSPDQTRIAF